MVTDLEQHPIIPVVVIEHEDTAVDLAGALAAGGITCAEITLRTSASLGAIAAIAAAMGDGFLVGAGTVTRPDDVDAIASAGARFAVSPGFDEEIVDRALSRGLTALPGTATATEVQAAARHGLSVVKVFPADRLGGVKMIRALAGPFPAMRFIPSGGVSIRNAGTYLAHPSVPAVCGSWMVPAHLLRARRFESIRDLAREATDAVGGLAPHRRDDDGTR